MTCSCTLSNEYTLWEELRSVQPCLFTTVGGVEIQCSRLSGSSTNKYNFPTDSHTCRTSGKCFEENTNFQVCMSRVSPTNYAAGSVNHVALNLDVSYEQSQYILCLYSAGKYPRVRETARFPKFEVQNMTVVVMVTIYS